MRPRGAAKGFTLVEVLLALGIVSALLVIALGGLRLGTAAWRRGDERAERLQHARGLDRLLVRALGGAYPYRVGARGQDVAAFSFDGAAERLTFVTTAPPVPPGGPTAFTAVSLAREEAGLTVREGALPDLDPMERRAPVLVDPSVTKLRFRYLRGEDRTWRERWDAAAENGLPAAVEVTLALRRDGRTVEPSPLVIQLRAGAS